MMKLRGLTCAALALGLSYSTAAAAQEQMWLKDRRYGEGIGIRAGDLEVHPGIAGEFGYDSNYFLRADSENPIGTFRLRITPSLSLSTISSARREAERGTGEPPKVAFRAGVAASYSEFIATSSANSDALSKQRNVGAIGNLQLTILPQHRWSADLFADFLRTVQPSEDPEFNFDRISARFGGGLSWAPGGGMFDWRLGYEYGLTFFEDLNFRNLSNGYHQVNTRGRWRFLPRTAFLFDATATFFGYNNNPSGAQLDSDPIRARVGLNGLVTSSFAMLAMVGWGSSFYKGSNAQQYDGPLVQAELKWFVTPNPGTDPTGVTLVLSSIALGYNHDFFNSYLGDYFLQDRGYLNMSFFFSGRLLLVATAGVAALQYPTVYGVPAAGGVRPALHDPFTTVRLDGQLFGEYRFSDTFGVNATARYTANLTDVVIPATGPNRDALKWNRFEAFLGVRWFL